MKKVTRIALISRNRIFRLGVEKMIEQWSGYAFYGSLNVGSTLEDFSGMHAPDLIIADLDPSYDWEFKKIKWIKTVYPKIQIVGVFEDFGNALLMRFVNCGLRSFLRKNASEKEFKRCLLVTLNRGYYYTADLAESLAQEILSPSVNAAVFPTGELNQRETQTLDLMCRGASNEAIANTLGISSRTVEGYRTKIKQKLEAPSFPNAVIKAIEYGIIQVAR